jgi:hypothetical protein
LFFFAEVSLRIKPNRDILGVRQGLIVTNRRSLTCNRDRIYGLRSDPRPGVSSGIISKALSNTTGFYT